MTKVDKDSDHPICERSQCIIRYTTEPVALTGRQACQTSQFILFRLTSHVM